MWRVIVCDGDQEEREQLTAYIRRYLEETGVKGETEGCKNWEELAALVKREEPSCVVVAQNGVEGLDIITSARVLAGKIVWFSDLDFGVQAYRLCVAYFNQKPVTYQKMARALSRKMEDAKGVL